MYNAISNVLQIGVWWADICYNTLDYNVETIAAEDVKFKIYGAIEVSMGSPGQVVINRNKQMGEEFTSISTH